MKINKKNIWKNIEPIVFGLALAIFIKTFFVQAYIIPSASMMNTLLIGDCLLANKLAYNIKVPFTNKIITNINNPKRNDVVIFKYPKNPKINYIKRVIGLPGETIEIKNNKTLINGVTLKDNCAVFIDYPFIPAINNFGPICIPDNHIFVMGDNRNNSNDSRNWGFVNINSLEGKAILIYWSWDKVKKRPRLKRIFNTLNSNN